MKASAASVVHVQASLRHLLQPCSMCLRQKLPALQRAQRFLTAKRLHSTQSMKLIGKSMLLKRGKPCRERDCRRLLLSGRRTQGQIR